jgi:DNA-binding transcriptional MerR regulator
LGAAPLVTIVEAARRTGVASITLRAWERRYGVPRPVRTPAGYRLYNARDLRDVAALIAYRDSGIATRQAAFLVSRQRTLSVDGASSPRVVGWRRRLEAACIRFDDPAASAVIGEASTLLPTSELLRHVVFPVVASLGEGRDSGVISISQEHFASELARRLVSRLDPAVAGKPARGLVLTGCAPGELHELGLLSVVCQLRDAGRRVVHLGPNVPVPAFLSTLDAVRPRTAIVAVTLDTHLKEWRMRRSEVEARARRGVRFVWAGPGSGAAARAGLPGAISNSIDEVVAAAITEDDHSGLTGAIAVSSRADSAGRDSGGGARLRKPRTRGACAAGRSGSSPRPRRRR